MGGNQHLRRVTSESIQVDSIVAEHISARSGLSPADQHLITTLENKHVTLPEFQRMHGLEPDGILGPKTQAVIRELEYKRRNVKDLDNLVADTISQIRPIRMPSFTPPPPSYTPLRAAERGLMSRGDRIVFSADGWTVSPMFQAVVGDVNYDRFGGASNVHTIQTNRAQGRGPITHFAIVLANGKRTKWFRLTETFFADHNYLTFPPGELRCSATNDTVAQGGWTSTTVEKVQGTVQVPHPTPNVSKVMVKEGDRRDKRKRPQEKLTREAYRLRFSEMQYSVVKAALFGFIVVVTLADGRQWQYRRPTRKWAERTGAKRLKRELAKLTLRYELDNPQGVKAKDLGMHFPLTTDELTAELAKDDAERREREQAEWDKAFHGEEKP